MATLMDILGGGLPPGLLSPEQEAAAEQRARNAGLLNFAFGALQASRGVPGQGRPGLGQIIGQAGPVGVAGYQQSFDQTLQNLMRGVQLSQTAAGIQRQRAIQEAKMLPTLQEQVQALQGLGAYDEIKNLAEAQKVLRQSGVMRQPGMEEIPSPFAPYMAAQSPEVRKLAETYNRGFQQGTIDEETAFKRLESLGRMEDAFIGRQESRAERESAREQARLDRELARQEGRAERELAREEKRMEGTEGQRSSAGYAERMVVADSITKQLPETALPTVGTAVAGGVPLVGGYLQRRVMSPEQQLYKQAADDWIRAKLRKESGAVIGEEEMAREYETYFPQPGDTKQVIAQKEAARKTATSAMIKNAGAVYKAPELPTVSTAQPAMSNLQEAARRELQRRQQGGR